VEIWWKCERAPSKFLLLLLLHDVLFLLLCPPLFLVLIYSIMSADVTIHQ